jgi:sec-independent protein translocase protein TatA
MTMPNLGGPELIIILVVLLLLFGGKRLPDLAKGLGKSLNIFKSELKKAADDDEKPSEK